MLEQHVVATFHDGGWHHTCTGAMLIEVRPKLHIPLQTPVSTNVSISESRVKSDRHELGRSSFMVGGFYRSGLRAKLIEQI